MERSTSAPEFERILTPARDRDPHPRNLPGTSHIGGHALIPGHISLPTKHTVRLHNIMMNNDDDSIDLFVRNAVFDVVEVVPFVMRRICPALAETYGEPRVTFGNGWEKTFHGELLQALPRLRQELYRVMGPDRPDEREWPPLVYAAWQHTVTAQEVVGCLGDCAGTCISRYFASAAMLRDALIMYRDFHLSGGVHE